MELTKLFATIGVALIAIIAITAYFNSQSTEYGYTDVGTSFNSTLNHVQTITNATIITISNQAANNTQAQSGSGSSASSTSQLVYRGLAIIGIIPSMIGLVPAMISDAAIILGVPETYVVIGIAVFIFVIAMVLAYIFVLGAKVVR